MALNELKVDIAEKYLENVAKGIYNRVKAVEDIHPSVKHPNVYAYKLWRDKDFKLYLKERSKELMAEKHNFLKIANTSMVRVKEAVGLKKKSITVIKDGVGIKIEGHFPSGKEALRFAEVFNKFSNIALTSDEVKSVYEEHREELENKKFAEDKKNKKENQERAEKRLNLDRERLGIHKDKINGKDDGKSKSIAELREEYGM